MLVLSRDGHRRYGAVTTTRRIYMQTGRRARAYDAAVYGKYRFPRPAPPNSGIMLIYARAYNSCAPPYSYTHTRMREIKSNRTVRYPFLRLRLLSALSRRCFTRPSVCSSSPFVRAPPPRTRPADNNRSRIFVY